MRYLPGVKQETTSTTTSAVGQTLTVSAVTGFPTFASYSPVTNEIFPVTVTDGTNMEMGYWKYTASNTLTRTNKIVMTWNGSTTSSMPATGIAWGSGTKTVICAPLAVDNAAANYANEASLKVAFPRSGRPGATVQPTDSRVYAFPIDVEAPGLATGCPVEVSTAQAGACNSGLYACDEYGMPGVRIAQASGTADTNSGNALKPLAFASSVFVSPGRYWVLFINDSTTTVATFRALTAGGNSSDRMGNSSSTASLGNLWNLCFYKAGSGTTLDAEYTGTWTQQSTGAVPVVGLTFA